jgi:hypothetical protein
MIASDHARRVPRGLDVALVFGMTENLKIDQVPGEEPLAGHARAKNAARAHEVINLALFDAQIIRDLFFVH